MNGMTSDGNGIAAIRVFHEREEGEGIHAMLQPVGVSYNGDMQALKRGDAIMFWDEKVGVVVDVCEVPIRLHLFHVLCKMIYGEGTPRAKVIDRWREHAEMMGNGMDAISTRKCLMIRYINK